MGKYLKEFSAYSQYETYINGSGAILPNVSICNDNLLTVYYNPYVEAKVIAVFEINKYDIDPEYPTQILYTTDYISSIEVDGVTLPELVTNYLFETEGEHTIIFTLSDPTTFGTSFHEVSKMTNIILPNTVTSLDDGAFSGCCLENITIPNSVTSIGEGALECESYLKYITIPESVVSIGNHNPEWFAPEEITFLSTIPQTTYSNLLIDSLHKIYVPAEAVAAYKQVFENYWYSGSYYDYESYAEMVEAIPTT